jgi:Rrf2 family protein
MGLQLTSAAEYAIVAMIHIGSLPTDGVALTSKIAREESIPPSYLAKVLRRLVNAGLLRSARGGNGGFRLQRPAAEITLLEIIEGVELTPKPPPGSPDRLRRARNHSPAGAAWLDVQRQMIALLRKTTIEAHVSVPRKRNLERRDAG